MNEERRIENIPIEKIIPNIYQPRIKFDNDSIEELSKSIKVHGIIQPLILRKIGEKYEIVDGERRYKAAKKAELKTLPSIVLEISEEEAAELILTENMQKQKLTPIEEANAYQQLILLNNFDITELAEKLGKGKITIENKLKLLTLHPEIQESLLNNKISEGHAKLLTKLDSRTEQLEIYNKILEERIPVKELEEIIKNPFKTKKEKENKAEVEFMDNSQLNFNQYNDLLKEQEKPQMAATTTPEPILSSMSNQVNNFFPSLEDQPLNIGVPLEQEDASAPIEIPQFVVGEQNIQVAQAPMASEIPTPVMEVPQMPETMAMPQFEVPAPTMPVPEAPVAPEMPTPVMEVQQTSVNVEPAVNMIKNLIPLLGNAGYNVLVEESDTPGEYQFIIKVQK